MCISFSKKILKCDSGGSRTPNLLIRSQVLYPVKLQSQSANLKTEN